MVAVLAVAVLTGGCGGGGSGPAQVPAGTGDRLPALSVECSGGLAGVQDRLDIQPDGTATASQRQDPGAPVTRLGASERENLARTTRQAAARTYRPVYRTEGAADLFTYRIRFDTVAVTADEMAIPAELAAIIDALAPVRTRLHLPC
ncbi:MAG: hypothetical protein V7637_759 [Mycobacteriales bacterium]|jgi:hypothetical protein